MVYVSKLKAGTGGPRLAARLTEVVWTRMVPGAFARVWDQRRSKGHAWMLVLQGVVISPRGLVVLKLVLP